MDNVQFKNEIRIICIDRPGEIDALLSRQYMPRRFLPPMPIFDHEM